MGKLDSVGQVSLELVLLKGNLKKSILGWIGQ